jgi:hypothetical protein
MAHPKWRLPRPSPALHDASRTQRAGDIMITQRSSVSGSVGGGQVLAAVGILFGLAVTAPLIGIILTPFAAASSFARAMRH